MYCKELKIALANKMKLRHYLPEIGLNTNMLKRSFLLYIGKCVNTNLYTRRFAHIVATPSVRTLTNLGISGAN